VYSFIIVDDEPLIRKGILKKVRAFDRSLSFIGEADNGVDALTLIEEQQPDILLTDMRMPELDGKLLMRTVHQRYPAIKMIVISGHSDFDYMREAISAKAISYLLKPFSREELHEALRQAVEQLDEEHAAHLEAGAHLAEHESIGYAADVQTLLQSLLGLQSSPRAPQLRSRTCAPLQEAPRRLLLLACGDGPLSALPADTPPGTLKIPHPQGETLAFVLVPSQPERGRSDSPGLAMAELQYAQRLAAAWAAGSAGCCRIGAAPVLPDLSGLHEAQLAAVAALDRQLLREARRTGVFAEGETPLEGAARQPFGGERAASGVSDDDAEARVQRRAAGQQQPLDGDSEQRPLAADFAPGSESMAFADWGRAHELLFSIESGRTARVRELLDELFASYDRQPEATIGQLKSQCRIIVTEARRLLALHLKSDETSTPSRSLEAVLSAAFDRETLLAYLQQTLGGIASLLGQDSAYASGEVFDHIKHYLDQHYREELTLERVASLFYLNPSYLSHRFKDKTGENFTDYINRLRIEQARHLLRSTDDKVYRIAKTLGYDNPKYFFRVFKRLTGLTPEAFRNEERA